MKKKLATLFLLQLYAPLGVYAEEQKEKDGTWKWASEIEQKNRGAKSNRKPKHILPYNLEKYHTELELNPPYQVDPKDLMPIQKKDLMLLRTEVNNMKDDIFNTKAEVFELNNTKSQEVKRDLAKVLEKEFSFISINHLDRLSDLYMLAALSYYLDGKKIYSFKNDLTKSFKSSNQAFKVYEGVLPPGRHSLTVSAIYQGNGDGVFKYLSEYRVRVLDDKSFVTNKGGSYRVTMKAFETGRFYTSFKERPSFQISVLEDK